MKIKKNDTVVIITGKDKGKKGKVRRVLPGKNQLFVEGINMIKRHSRTRGAARQAGIIELEAPVHCSNVMLLCPKCGKPTRIGSGFLEDGRKVRLCHSCHEAIE